MVVKPSVSSGAQNTSRYGPDDHVAARTHMERLLSDGRTVMVQPYVTSVDADGETGLIYIDGRVLARRSQGPAAPRDRGCDGSTLGRRGHHSLATGRR